MLRHPIIGLTALLMPCTAFAQDQSVDTVANAYADRHWAYVAARCPAQAKAHVAATDNAIYQTLKLASALEPDDDAVRAQSQLDALSELDIYFGAFALVNAATVSEALQYMAQFDADADGSKDEKLKARTEVSVALSACLWPSTDERSALNDSQWADGFDAVAEGVCEIHFFTMVQRYLDAPIVQMVGQERQDAGDTLIALHEQYLEASKDASQCGEFL